MIAVRPEHAAAMPGNPPLFDVGCAGTIGACETLPDGRYRFVLGATRRFRILREVPEDDARLYRVAEVAWLDDPFVASDAAAVAAHRHDVIQCISALTRRAAPDRSPELSAERLAGIDDVRLVNALCQMLDLPTLEKQGLLEANGVRERYERLASLLRFRLAESGWEAGDHEPRRH
jgi:Lon protease-like protein